MSGFGMICEDPFYDEDGVLIDEDFEFDDVAEMPQDLEDLSPFITINS